MAHLTILAYRQVIVKDESRHEVNDEWNQAPLDKTTLDFWHICVEECQHYWMTEPALLVQLLEELDEVTDPFTVLE